MRKCQTNVKIMFPVIIFTDIFMQRTFAMFVIFEPLPTLIETNSRRFHVEVHSRLYQNNSMVVLATGGLRNSRIMD